jgi:hypothetical protein
MFRGSEIRFDLGLWHLCRPAVSLAPSSQTSHELHTEAEARVLPSPREGCRPRNEPRSLPSVVPAGAIQRVIDPCCSPSGIFRRAPPIGVGWSDEASPCHSKRPGRTSCDAKSEVVTSRCSSRPRKEQLTTRGVGRLCASLSRDFKPPISATRFRHAGTPVSRRSSSMRGCRPCPRLLCSESCDSEELKSHAVCRSSPHRPSRATCRTFRCRELMPMVWPAGRRGEPTELLR